MTDIAALKELLERVEKAEGPGREMDEKTLVALGGKRKGGDWWIGHSYIGRSAPAYTSSIDACVALIEKVLPDWCYEISLLGEQLCFAEIWEVGEGGYSATVAKGDARTLPLALLAALLSALIAKEEGNA
jgi:hypothetical protein